ncbi:DUF2264 domain-containing protein [Rahnella sp. SL6]|uniref:DUF2264 domain-containing protein n=1 Tax=Rahnella perminowiae TaxID=2816244 RepID=UPI001C25D956|nr:DUF2264 domain-containing protein [Rahnella perminowiae]MBU9810132.1 DUF2264 domain-containing protein [Rahnella perminowiae]
MTLKKVNINNPLQTRDDVQHLLKELLSAVSPYTEEGKSGINLGNSTTHYGKKIAEMEALSRMLWGIFPLLAGGGECEDLSFYLDAIRFGTDPQHPQYWGDIRDFDQRCVEMAAFGVGLTLLDTKLLQHFSVQEQQNLADWLNQGRDATIPNNNWNFFPVMVQMGFKTSGLPWDQEAVAARFALMEDYYLGDGWYSDGPGRPRDYYISMAFHYYGLLYAQNMADVDASRAAMLRERAQRFAQDFITMFSAGGAAVPFGRSLTYRFAEAAFWSAAAYSQLDVFTPGIIKGLILRHLRHWLKEPIFDRDGVLSIGYHTPNLVMAEDYNAPGSPYWACKLFLVLALPPDDAFWAAEEAPLPALPDTHCIPHASQILTRDAGGQHVVMLTSGQLELNNFVNTEAKYTKFAYSSQFGFTLDRGRYGLNHAGCDSMLMFSEGDGYYRGRRDCADTRITVGMIYSRWLPWHDVAVRTWLIPCGDWHLRVHHIENQRPLETAEGGFAVMQTPSTQILHPAEKQAVTVTAGNGISRIAALEDNTSREASTVITPPNSSIMFAETAAIPVLKNALPVGSHWLITAVSASASTDIRSLPLPEVSREGQQLRWQYPGHNGQIILA